MKGINKYGLERSLKSWLEEDMPFGDLSSENIFAKDDIGQGELIAKEQGVLCGTEVFEMVYRLLDTEVKLVFNCMDGDEVEKGQIIGRISGPTASVLSLIHI